MYILSHNEYKQYTKAYLRYIDDTLILFKAANSQAKVMFNITLFKQNNKNMQFALEKPIDDKISFLNLINISNNNFNFNLYKKLIQTTYNTYN